MKYKILYHMVKRVQSSLSGGTPLEDTDIILAVIENKINIIDENLDFVTKGGMTLAMIAANYNKLDTLKYLVEQGAKCDDTIKDSNELSIKNLRGKKHN